jgi:nitroreductase
MPERNAREGEMSDALDHETERRQAMVRAAEAARFAPSVHNTQPWRWVVHADRLELHAATERQLQVEDPDAHLLLVSCGTALHHAQLALAAEGWAYTVERPGGGPLAIVRPTGRGAPDPTATRHYQMVQVRHTDRRTVTDQPVPADVLDDLVAVTERAGARLHLLTRDQVIDLAVAMEQAEKAHGADEQVQAELARWVGADRPAGAGIPGANIPQELPLTTVAERDFGTAGDLPAGAGHDTAATYGVLYGPGDEPAGWLRAGEALSALWLAANEHGVNVLPLSTPIEVPFARSAVQRLLGGVGHPYLALRIGALDPQHAGPAATPRLPREQVIEIGD